MGRGGLQRGMGTGVGRSMSKDAEPSERARLFERIDRLTIDPGRAGTFTTRILAPFARFTNYRPSFSTAECAALFTALDDLPEADASVDAAVAPVRKRLGAARSELVDNLERTELVGRAHGSVPIAHAAWLFRLARVLDRIGDALDRKAAARLRGFDRMLVTPPLALAKQDGKPKGSGASRASADGDAPDASSEAFERTRRLLDLQLVAIDHVLGAASEEQQFLERRRRLLEGARRLLLDASGSLSLDPSSQRTREDHIAREISRVDALQASGLSATIGLTHQARTALRRGDREKLVASLVAIEGFADRTGNTRRGSLAAHALTHAAVKRRARPASGEALTKLTEDVLGVALTSELVRVRADAHAKGTLAQRSKNDTDRSLALMTTGFYAPGRLPELAHAVHMVDGLFEVGASLSPLRATELETYARLVHHPTPEMVVVLAREPEDIKNAILEDPRMVLLDLAAGRLLAKRWIERKTRTVTRTRLIGEVRVYVLDASGSMWVGARAAMRDAIMLTEIATTMRRFEESDRSTRLSLYYAYFTDQLGPVRRVADTAEGLAAVGDVAGTPRSGGTNIQAALEGALAVIREARLQDPELARASIVLVTDGQSPLDANKLAEARRGTQGVSIGVSVIALGEENPVLRDLVAAQRRAGERAFYHYLDDDRLNAVAKGDFDVSTALNLPTPVLDLERQRDALERTLDELVELDRPGPPEDREELTPRVEGPLALEEAASRDAVSLGRRFAKWFPAPSVTPAQPDVEPLPPEVEATVVILATVAEVVGELGGTAENRRADAVALLERLLPDARISAGRYREILGTHSSALAPSLSAVHTAARGAHAWFDEKLRTRRGHST